MNPDLFSGAGLLLWVVPIAILSASVSLGGLYPVIAWPLALGFMGAVCLVNARRCGRRHCLFTGPFFLLMAVISLLDWTRVLDLGTRGWSKLSVVLLLGGVLLTCVQEALWGRYARRGKGSHAP